MAHTVFHSVDDWFTSFSFFVIIIIIIIGSLLVII